MQRILLLDNFDSFTFNLAQYLIVGGAEVDVVRYDELSTDPCVYDKIVFSPGPGLPDAQNGMHEIIMAAEGKIPILGVCLGMQAIGLYLGGELYNQRVVKHGVQENVQLNSSTLFRNMPEQIEVGLYHSWALKKGVGKFNQTALSEGGVLMALEHEASKLYGVQFHPESIMTPLGSTIINNFLQVE